MKIETKSTLGITAIGITTIMLFGYIYVQSVSASLLQHEMEDISAIIKEVSHHVETYFEEKIIDVQTLATVPSLVEHLEKSNSEFRALEYDERISHIEKLNDKWMQTTDNSAPFIQSYYANKVSKFLSHQQQMFPELYGEIFLTNKYGAMIATTGKLTTLSHSHKYWWKEAYNNGLGKVFLDDRGFDKSVKRNVLGIVVPVYRNGEVIGILKCNILTTEQLSYFVKEMSSRHHGTVKIARTGGKVVAEEGVQSLSTSIELDTLKQLLSNEDYSSLILRGSLRKLISQVAIPITEGDARVGFGGKYSSIDQSGGNPDERWHVILERDLDSALKPIYDTARVTVIAGIITTIIIAFLSRIFSRMISKPIVSLTKIATEIGNGNLSVTVPDSSSDEIRELGRSIKQMTENLEATMASRDELEAALQNVKMLSGLIPICAKCKKVRDDRGYWNQLEKYITEHSEALFSHSICESCMEEMYGDLGFNKSNSNDNE